MHEFMKNMQIKLIYVFGAGFIFLMLKLFETSVIKLIKLRIKINFFK